jgi:Flp pilus assembly protein TadD
MRERRDIVDRARLFGTGFTASPSRLAWTRYQKKNFRGAAELYAAILVQYPGDTEMRNGLGWSLLSLGRKDDAAAAFREVLAMVPRQADATQGLATASR